jgi:hypothetical protein
MKKINMKIKQYVIISALILVSIVLVGIIYKAGESKHDDKEVASMIYQADTVNVDGIDAASADTEVNHDVDGSDEMVTGIEVEPIDINENHDTDSSVAESEQIDVKMPVEPEKPDTVPPEYKPVTTDDLTNLDKEPEYVEEDITYIPEPEHEEPSNEPIGTYTVPDSENPFLQDNIPSNGDGGEIQGEDLYQDGIPAGDGDKF